MHVQHKNTFTVSREKQENNIFEFNLWEQLISL
jgi:hypothetical protein